VVGFYRGTGFQPVNSMAALRPTQGREPVEAGSRSHKMEQRPQGCRRQPLDKLWALSLSKRPSADGSYEAMGFVEIAA